MIDKILKAARHLAADEASIVAARHHSQRRDLAELLELTRDYFNPGRSPSHCKKCGAPLLWVKTTRGANAPLDAVMIVGIDADGVSHRVYLNHFSTCPHADDVRREKQAASATDGKTKAAG